jgi:membrane protein implicated in regulation of membrane protease activity
LSDEALDEQAHYASLFSIVRFGPGAITILVLIALTTIVFYKSGLQYFAIVSGAAGATIFGVKSMEIIRLSHPEKRQLIGRRCYVVKRVERGRMGIVRVYGQNGRLEPELWSAESSQTISEGQTAEVMEIRSIVLLIKPVESNADSESKNINARQLEASSAASR